MCPQSSSSPSSCPPRPGQIDEKRFSPEPIVASYLSISFLCFQFTTSLSMELVTETGNTNRRLRLGRIKNDEEKGFLPCLDNGKPHLRNLKASLLLIARPLSSMYSKLTVGL